MRGYRLENELAFFRPQSIVVVAEGSDGEIVAFAGFVYVSQKKGLPEQTAPTGFEMRRSSFFGRLMRRYVLAKLEVFDRFLDKSADREAGKRLRDENRTPVTKLKDNDGENIFDADKADHHWSLISIATEPDWQGKGIAQSLVRWGKELVKMNYEDGQPDLVLDLTANPGLQSYYEKLGFTQYSTCGWDGLSWDEMVWWPSLDAARKT